MMATLLGIDSAPSTSPGTTERALHDLRRAHPKDRAIVFAFLHLIYHVEHPHLEATGRQNRCGFCLRPPKDELIAA
jgi:hypothetical protein